MSAPVYISGTGVITAIGNDTATNLDALRSGSAGMGPIRWLETRHQGQLPVAEVKSSNEMLAEKAGLPAHFSRTSYPDCLLLRQRKRCKTRASLI